MFTGIVEELGDVIAVKTNGTNKEFTIRASFAPELQVDQSVAHNGVCLTVVGTDAETYRVTAVQETLGRTNLGQLQTGSHVNLERSLRLGDRIDGHMVQGHVDAVTKCVGVHEHDGSWSYAFSLPEQEHLLVMKGSVCLNGVSLTIARLDERQFSVAVIPYTHANTTFRELLVGDAVNVEFDVLGKYVERMLAMRSGH